MLFARLFSFIAISLFLTRVAFAHPGHHHGVHFHFEHVAGLIISLGVVALLLSKKFPKDF